MTLVLLEVSIDEISAGTDCNLQTGALGVVGQSQLQLPCHSDTFKEATVCADAADTALKEQNMSYSFFVCLKGQEDWTEWTLNSINKSEAKHRRSRFCIYELRG